LDVLNPLAIKAQVIVVDDNSPDGTAGLIKKRFSSRPEIELVIRKKERGLATAIAAGIERSRFDLIAVMDTDFNHHPKDLPRLLEGLPEADIVIGSRYVPGGGMKTSRFRYLGSWIFNLFIRSVLWTPIKDNLSGFLILKKEVFSRLRNRPIFYGYGDYCIRLLHHARKSGFIIREVPVVYEFRQGGESKTDFGRHLVDYIKATLALRFGK
jgi:dolichol-phosphate mannosyltransferase